MRSAFAAGARALFEEVDNSPLVAFRIVAGFCLACECAGAVATGWVTATFVEPPFTLPVYGFEWVRPLAGEAMYAWYLVMAALGALVMLGVRYRASLVIFTVMWSATHVMQLTRYNNHHYLMILVCLLLLVCPADRRASWDVRRDPAKREWTCPRWCLLAFALQMSIVYVYGGIAKVDADWLAGTPLSIWFAAKTAYPIIGPLYAEPWLPGVLAWGGLLFDLLVVPLMVWRRTRIAAIVASGLFHLFNAITFGVGMFPVLGFAFALFFVSPSKVGQWLFRAAGDAPAPTARPGVRVPAVLALLSLFFAVQLLMPLRHVLYEGHPSWTEEGHRMAWRMMLRAKTGVATFRIRDRATGEEWSVSPVDHLAPRQAYAVASQPAATWQFVRYLVGQAAAEGHADVEVFGDVRASLNGRSLQPLVDPRVDLAKADWSWFRHSDWIVPLQRSD